MLMETAVLMGILTVLRKKFIEIRGQIVMYVLVMMKALLLDQRALRNHLLGQECSIMLPLLRIVCEIRMRQRKNMHLVTVNTKKIFVVCLMKEVRKNSQLQLLQQARGQN